MSLISVDKLVDTLTKTRRGENNIKPAVCVIESDGSVETDSDETLTLLLKEVRSDIKCANGQNADCVQVYDSLKTTSNFSILDVRSE